jgi:biopolymer transport protein TolR
MGMTSGNSSGSKSSEINVTPLIDILLVLLIIFMVIVPVAPKGLAALAPQPAKDDGSVSPTTIVVSVLHLNDSQVGYKINQNEVAKNDLQAQLTAIYANRAERVMFVKGDNQVNFSQVAEVIDAGHAAGVDQVGLLTPKIEAGQ